jgi:4-alpha-glucanotransferase
VAFHAWLQSLCDQQLTAVDEAARSAGMSVGIVHDLAVGTDPGGADAWQLRDVLALDAHIGSPPDPFNQQGQDWGLPPWHPTAMAERHYEPLRDLVIGTLTHAGGIRIDHVLGMFRAWWVPADRGAKHGSYVTYDAAGMLGAIIDAARETDAIVVGEDLGTVTPDMRTTLHSLGILGTSVLWFEREDPADGQAGRLRPLRDWRAGAAASVTTHDLPTALGWLRGEHVRVRAELGLLDDPAAEEKSWMREREELLELLRAEGLVGDDPDEDELLLALHGRVDAVAGGVRGAW